MKTIWVLYVCLSGYMHPAAKVYILRAGQRDGWMDDL